MRLDAISTNFKFPLPTKFSDCTHASNLSNLVQNDKTLTPIKDSVMVCSDSHGDIWLYLTLSCTWSKWVDLNKVDGIIEEHIKNS